MMTVQEIEKIPFDFSLSLPPLLLWTSSLEDISPAPAEWAKVERKKLEMVKSQACVEDEGERKVRGTYSRLSLAHCGFKSWLLSPSLFPIFFFLFRLSVELKSPS